MMNKFITASIATAMLIFGMGQASAGVYSSEQVIANQTLFGVKYIVLPNPMYGDWEKLLYNGDKLTEQDRAKQRLNKLKSY